MTKNRPEGLAHTDEEVVLVTIEAETILRLEAAIVGTESAMKSLPEAKLV